MQAYKPEIWAVKKDDIYSARAALIVCIERLYDLLNYYPQNSKPRQHLQLEIDRTIVILGELKNCCIQEIHDLDLK